MNKRLVSAVLAVTCVVSLAACDTGETGTPEGNAKKSVEQHARQRAPYLPKNDVEFNNYNKAQELYDTPSTIIWCTTTWGNANAPLVTVPVAGKLTSSSTTFFRPEAFFDRGNYSWQQGTARSVDGLFHPNPPQYRYGFTPGGQYIDFFNMPTFCTTALTKLQRQVSKVALAVSQTDKAADLAAQNALSRGNHSEAQKILERAVEGDQG